MTKFSVGDRVRERGTKDKGTVLKIHSSSKVKVRFDGFYGFDQEVCDPELLIKLKKKVKRVPMEIWIQCLQERPRFICHRDDVNAVLFREVL